MMDVFVLLAGLASVRTAASRVDRAECDAAQAFTSDVLFEELLATDGDSFERMSSELNTFSKLQTAPSFPANFPTVPANCTVAGGYTQVNHQDPIRSELRCNLHP